MTRETELSQAWLAHAASTGMALRTALTADTVEVTRPELLIDTIRCRQAPDVPPRPSRRDRRRRRAR